MNELASKHETEPNEMLSDEARYHNAKYCSNNTALICFSDYDQHYEGWWPAHYIIVEIELVGVSQAFNSSWIIGKDVSSLTFTLIVACLVMFII